MLFAVVKVASCPPSLPCTAITSALALGLLDRTRWESYQKLQREARYAADRVGVERERRRLNRSWEREWRKVPAHLKRGDR